MILNLVNQRAAGPQDSSPEGWVPEHETLLAALADGLGKKTWAVNLVLVPDSNMVGLNEGFRQKDGVTDVLSFSYLDFEGEGSPHLAAGKGHAAVDLWEDPTGGDGVSAADEPLVVGEIVLAPDFVFSRCLQNNWSADLELPMLVVHGLLHILGWEHDLDEDRQAMQDIEEAVLAEKKLAHPLRQRS